MKISLLTFILFITINLQNTFSQCCPYLDNVELSPTPATDIDSIILTLQVSTPGLGEFLGYNIIETDTLTTVEACYYSGPLAAIQTYNDEINLGVRPGGVFKVKFIAWISGSDTICNYSQNQFIDLEIEVEGTNAVFSPQVSPISIFPNPIQNNKISLSSKEDFSKIQIFNQLGVLVLEQNDIRNNHLTLDLSQLTTGVYFLKTELDPDNFYIEKIIKE